MGLEALKELEDLASPSDMASVAAALARSINPESPESPSAHTAALMAAPTLAADADLLGIEQLLTESLADEAPPKDMTEAEQCLAEELLGHVEALGALDAGGEAPRGPPPSLGDLTPQAQAARLPAVVALEEVAHGTRAAAETPERSPRRAASLSELLETVDMEPLAAAGDLRVQVSGIADAPELLRPGGLAVLTLQPGPARGAQVNTALAMAGAAGAAAAVLLGAEEGDAAHVEAWLKVGNGLEALALLPESGVAPCLARAFWGNPAVGLECLLVRGEEPLEVRMAAWMLARLAESRAGPGTAALLGARATLHAGVGHLTSCLVQERLAAAVAAGAELCVVEALPGAHLAEALDGISFSLEVDCQEQLLRMQAAMATGAPHTFRLDPLKRKPSLKLGAEARGLGLRPTAPFMLKAQVEEGGHEGGGVEEGGPGSSWPSSWQPGVLHGQVLPGTCLSSLQLALGMKDHGTAQVALPLVGITGVTAALAAAGAAMARWGSAVGEPGAMHWLSAALKSMPAPPGTLEVLTASSAPKVVAVLHEAETLDEVRGALTAVREWLHLGNDGAEPRLTAVLGCPGEMGRGNRARYGWALAELCDCIVLTSDQPRAEPPLQVIEDILEAIRSRAPRKASFQALLAKDVHVVADRVDAIKLGACLSTSEEADPPGVLVLFGSGSGTQEAAGPDGSVRTWLCDDRCVLQEAIEAAERVSGLMDVSQVPWRDWNEKEPKMAPEKLRLPGHSLHWTHRVGIHSNGNVEQPL